MAGNDPGFFDTPGLPADYYYGSANTSNPFEHKYAELIANGVPPNVAYSIVSRVSYPEQSPGNYSSYVRDWPYSYSGRSAEEGSRGPNPEDTLWPGRQPYAAGPVTNMPGYMHVNYQGQAPIAYSSAMQPGVGMGSGAVPLALRPNLLTVSPDISDATAASRLQQPPVQGLQRAIQNPLMPFSPAVAQARQAVAQAVPRANLGPNVRYNSQGVPYNPDYVTGGQYGSTNPNIHIPAAPSFGPIPTVAGVATGPPTPLVPPPAAPNALGGTPTGVPDTEFAYGTKIPISIAKQLIRFREADASGYQSAWGVKGGLPANVAVDYSGFPTQEAYPGAPVGNVYGGAYSVDSKGQPLRSHAAGMYQIEPALWREAVAGLAGQGVTVKDFSPQSQEQVTTWILKNKGMTPWIGGSPPWNPRLVADYNAYVQTGQMPKGYAEHPLYKPEYASGGTSGGGAPEGTKANPLAVPLDIGAKAPDPAGPQSTVDKLADIEAQDRRFRNLLLYSSLLQQLRGGPNKPPLSGYDPEKVVEAGRTNVQYPPIPQSRGQAAYSSTVGSRRMAQPTPVTAKVQQVESV